MPDSAMATGTMSPQAPSTRAATGSAKAVATRTSRGAALASAAAGIQRANSPSTASMRSTTMLVSSPEWWPRSRDGPADSRRVSASLRRRRRAVAPASKAARSATTESSARSTARMAKPASSGRGSVPGMGATAACRANPAHQA